MKVRAPTRFIGTSEVWRDNGTGTGTFYLFFIPIWTWLFHHSTTFFD